MHNQALHDNLELHHKIQTELTNHGIYIHREEVAEGAYLDTINQLGDIVGEDDIKLNVTKRKLHSPGAIPFHTDSAVADLISWYCLDPGEAPQATDVLDTAPILDAMTSQEREDLQKFVMHCPNRSHNVSYPVPILTAEDDRHKIFYTPWFSYGGQPRQAVAAAEKFAALIKECQEAWHKSICLRKGQFFIIDNKLVE